MQYEKVPTTSLSFLLALHKTILGHNIFVIYSCSAIGQIFLHSHYEIFRSTGARRPFDEKSSRPRLWM